MAATQLVNLLTNSTVQFVGGKAHGFHTYIQDTIDQLTDTLELIRICRRAIKEAQELIGLPLCNIIPLAAAIKNAEKVVISLFPRGGGGETTRMEKLKANADKLTKNAMIAMDPGWYTTALARVSTDLVSKLSAMNWELSLVTARMMLLSSKGDSPLSASSHQEMQCADAGRLKRAWDAAEAEHFDAIAEGILRSMEKMKAEAPRKKERSDVTEDVSNKQSRLSFDKEGPPGHRHPRRSNQRTIKKPRMRLHRSIPKQRR